jgi:hypothetical protein
MTEEAIERVANEVLAALEIRSLPVDPLSIAGQEEIALLPGDYDDCFDGRIEYLGRGASGRFVLFYARPKAGIRPEGRVRFSVAHELGHFYLPQHRAFLVSGVWHGSRAGFVSEKPLEREADRFAAALLMPRKLFFQAVRGRGSVCTLNDLGRFADLTFQTSLTSTVIRYVQLDFEPCCVVLSRGGVVLFALASDEMRGLGLGWLAKHSPVPATSVTGRLIKSGADDRADGEVDADVWFDTRRSRSLWEETVTLGGTGMVITFLTCDGEDEDEAEDG